MADFLTLTWDSLFKERNKGGKMKRQKLTESEILNKIRDKIYEMLEDKSLSAEQQLAVNKVFEEVMLIIAHNKK